MASLNFFQIIGRIGSDPELKEFDKASVLNWSVAVQLYNQEEPTWVRCALWAPNDSDSLIKRQDAAAEYLHKGSLVFVSGIASASAYENKDQEIVPVLELRVNDWQKLSYDDDGQNGDYEEEEEEEEQPQTSGRGSYARSSTRASTSRASTRTSTSSRGSSARGASGKRQQEDKPREKTASRTARGRSAGDIPF